MPRKKEPTEIAPPAPAEEKVKNPDGEIFSLRVDVPIVNLNVNVVLDKTHQFVPGLKADNFLVVEDGVEQRVQSLRMTQTPITAVMLLEFAANSWAFIQDMQVASGTFFRTLRPDDYIAVVTYDMSTHILTDFTDNKDLVAGTTTEHDYGDGRITLEPVFVPREGATAEDDGWVMSYVYDANTNRSDVVILDSTDEPWPTVRAELPAPASS